MPRKIGFNVVSSSSHEDNFSARELMIHAPTVNGWRSSRLCPYPQHITLQLAERCRVRKLQLLAHQYLIPAKVEFHIGDTLPETSSPVTIGQLHRLGYVSLSDNERTGLKARELKSVHVDAIGVYLRITFHRNHVNRHNHYNQVALVAINVLGDSLDGSAFNTLPSREQLIEPYLNSTQLEAALDTTLVGKNESISQLDDLAFDMYQDPEVAHIIRVLDQRKQDMVRQEKYEQAKNLRQAIADLQMVGERLARYDVEKYYAIEKEDYDLAKKKKEQMDEYRSSVYKQLEVHNLLDMTMIKKAADSSPGKDPFSSLKDAPSPLSSPAYPSEPTKAHIPLRKGKKSNTCQNQLSDADVVPKLSKPPDALCAPTAVPKIDVTSLPFDERPLPTLQRKDPHVEVIQSPPPQLSPQLSAEKSPPLHEMNEEPESLTEKVQREAGLPIEVYGESLVAKAYSKTWSHRVDALLAVHKRLLEMPSTAPKEELRNTTRAAIFLVKRALLDKVAPVFQASLKLLQLMLSQVIPGVSLGRAEVTNCLDQTWPNLLARTGDSAGRIRISATVFVQEPHFPSIMFPDYIHPDYHGLNNDLRMMLKQEIAVLKDVRALQFIPGDLVKPFKSNFPSRLAQSRAELVEKLVADLGLENSGFTLENIMTFCTAALEHSVLAVRDVAARIILSMYKQHRSAVLSHLPPSDAAAPNSFRYKTLLDGFAKIDGKLSETQTMKKGGGPHDGQKEKEEIHYLREQLAALKEITERGSETPKEQEAMKEKETQKAGKRDVIHLPQNKITHTTDDQQSITYLDNLCVFCGKKDQSFTEDGLDLHYWKHCPMLRRCDECRQVVEIATLTEHLLRECESRSKFSQCSRCSEAVATEDLTQHVNGPTCNPPVSSKGSNHCPLCHNNFTPGEEAWKAHLMGREGCKQNSRRTAVYQKTQPAQGRPAGGAKLKQAWSVGARARPMGKGSRIPALAPQGRGQTPGKR